ncbi:MAG: dihydrolipoyl dehydrogenase [Hadesarchaea archaeon]|nr:dihydrolipoyl dehydrogenase [Hadesarchaea archaeon]
MSEKIIVIGAGPAGSVAAERCAQEETEVTLIERWLLGGCCLNVGCIPSKALLNASEIFHQSLNSEDLGVTANASIDYAKTASWKNNVVEKLRSQSRKPLERAGVTIKEGEGLFSSSSEIIVNDGENEESIEFDKAIIATGSEVIELPNFPFDHEAVLNSRQFIELEELPDRLLIVGAGYIGMELGTVAAKLGVDVTTIEMTNQILPGWDKRLIKPVEKKAKNLGIDFHFGLKATELKTKDNENIVIAENESGEEKEFPTNQVLVTVGRKPQVDGLNLDNTKVRTNENGFIETNESMQTNDPNIYAAGDVAGEPMLAHKAFRDAVIASNSILDKETPPRGHVPSVVFTDPKISQVGISPSKKNKSRHSVGRAYFRANGAAFTKNKTEGLARILFDKETETILGADIVGPDASELIHELCLAIENNLGVKEIVNTIHAHPTLSEIILKAAENAGEFPTYSL